MSWEPSESHGGRPLKLWLERGSEGWGGAGWVCSIGEESELRPRPVELKTRPGPVGGLTTSQDQSKKILLKGKTKLETANILSL